MVLCISATKFSEITNFSKGGFYGDSNKFKACTCVYSREL